jgi:hypothetical protein
MAELKRIMMLRAAEKRKAENSAAAADLLLRIDLLCNFYHLFRDP